MILPYFKESIKNFLQVEESWVSIKPRNLNVSGITSLA